MLYFDHNSTTPLAPEVAAVLNEANRECFGNASSLHRAGQRARQALEEARRSLTDCLAIAPGEFVFTSGGTEANNLAIAGVVRHVPGARCHIVISAIEHPAVTETVRALASEQVAVSVVPVTDRGVVDPVAVSAAIRPETVLVSVMHANNETGVIQPITDIAALVRARRAEGQEIYFHSDGVQALGKTPLNLSALGVDLYSVSAHKIYAPKGIGGLYIRTGVPLAGTQRGGRHERGRRAGTENVPAAVAFAKALQLCTPEDHRRVAILRSRFETGLLERLSGEQVLIHGRGENRLPNTSNIEFRGASGEALVISLDMQGLAVSTGAACSSGSIEPSHVLLAMGRSRAEAGSAVRFSFGRYNSIEDVDVLLIAVERTAKRMGQRGESRRSSQLVVQ